MELSEKVIFSHATLPDKCFYVFQNMKKNGECCDVRINFDNCTILAHRVILIAVFPGLNSLLECKNTSSNKREISSDKIEPRALEALIDFAYSFRLEITNENVEDLLTAALCLKAEEIVNACCDYIIKRITVQNAIEKLEFAEKVQCAPLVEACRQYVHENFDEVSTTEVFLQASFSCIKGLISSDDLRTSCEEKVFEAVMRWIKWCPEERKDNLPELLSCIRLVSISPEYLKDRVSMDEDIRTSLICRDLLDDAKYYHLMPKRRNELSTLVIRPRKKLCVRPAKSNSDAGIYAVSKRVIYDVQRLNIEIGKWESQRSFEQFYHTYTVTSSSDMIHFIDMEGLTSHDVKSSSWLSNRKVFNAKVCASSAVLQNKLYVCGGTDMKYCLNSVSCYDLEDKKCEIAYPMSIGRVLPGTVSLGEQLYVLGGLDCQRSSQRSVEKYNPNSKIWTTLTPMLVDRYGMGCAAHNGRIFVCGGKSISTKQFLSSAEVYDPVGNRWEFISPMKTQRFNFSLVSDGKKLYAIGGCSGDLLLNSVEIYNPDTNTWEFGPDTGPTQKYVQAVAVGYPI